MIFNRDAWQDDSTSPYLGHSERSSHRSEFTVVATSSEGFLVLEMSSCVFIQGDVQR